MKGQKVLSPTNLVLQIALTREQAVNLERTVLRKRSAGEDSTVEIDQLYQLLDKLTALEVLRDEGMEMKLHRGGMQTEAGTSNHPARAQYQ